MNPGSSSSELLRIILGVAVIASFILPAVGSLIAASMYVSRSRRRHRWQMLLGAAGVVFSALALLLLAIMMEKDDVGELLAEMIAHLGMVAFIIFALGVIKFAGAAVDVKTLQRPESNGTALDD